MCRALMRPWARATPGRSPQGALPFSGAPCQGPCPLRNFPFEARGPEPVWNTGPGSSRENESNGPTAKTGVNWVLFIFVNKEICLNGNQQRGCSFPPLRVLAAAAWLPTPGRTPVSSVGRAVRRGDLGRRVPGPLHPALPAWGSQSPPRGLPPACTDPRDRRLPLSLTHETQRHRRQACSWVGGVGLHTLVERFSLSEPQFAHLYHGKAGWPGGRSAGLSPLLSLRLWSGSGRLQRRTLGGTFASKWARMQTSDTQSSRHRNNSRAVRSPCPNIQGPGHPDCPRRYLCRPRKI